MKQFLYGAVVIAVAAVAPALAFAQSFPAVDLGQASASSHGPSYTGTTVAPVYAAPPAWSGYPSRAPGVDWGQASASSHGPSYPVPAGIPAYTGPEASASAHGPSFGGELSTERSH
jgi:hypothetical protein